MSDLETFLAELVPPTGDSKGARAPHRSCASTSEVVPANFHKHSTFEIMVIPLSHMSSLISTKRSIDIAFITIGPTWQAGEDRLQCRPQLKTLLGILGSSNRIFSAQEAPLEGAHAHIEAAARQSCTLTRFQSITMAANDVQTWRSAMCTTLEPRIQEALSGDKTCSVIMSTPSAAAQRAKAARNASNAYTTEHRWCFFQSEPGSIVMGSTRWADLPVYDRSFELFEEAPIMENGKGQVHSGNGEIAKTVRGKITKVSTAFRVDGIGSTVGIDAENYLDWLPPVRQM